MWREQGKGQRRVECMVLAYEYRVYLWISEINATLVKSVSDTLGRNMQLRPNEGSFVALAVPFLFLLVKEWTVVLLLCCCPPAGPLYLPLLVYWPVPWHVLNNKLSHRTYVPSCSIQQLDCLRIICGVQILTNAENSGVGGEHNLPRISQK